MKINQAPVVPAFQPVTLTFETLVELTKFVDDIGQTTGEKVIPYPVWSSLADITRGNFKS